MDETAVKKIEELEAELAELQADNVVMEIRLSDTENQLAVALGQMMLMKSDCNYDSPILN